ncbi:MAG: phosphoribosyltransferase family protein [Chloroflexota bacterium]|nr:hypothetical protein [Chloroflexota bacterium]
MSPEVHELFLYNIDFDGDRVINHSSNPFPGKDYSLYKYGSGCRGINFGFELADKFGQHLPHLLQASRLFVTSSAYKYVPTGSLTIGRGFLDNLNHLRYLQQLPSSHLVKMERTVLYPGDYGKLHFTERIELMSKNGLFVDREFIYGGNLVVVDDIKVTGEHQGNILKLAHDIMLKTITFLYIAGMADNAKAKRDARIEDHINHLSVRSLDDLLPIVQASDFAFNARVCKFLLSPQNLAALPRFLPKMNNKFVIEVYLNTIGDGYCFMEMYQANFGIIKQELQKRGLIVGDKLYTNIN